MKHNNTDSYKLDNSKKFKKYIVLPYVKNIYEKVSSSLKHTVLIVFQKQPIN